MKKFLIAFVLVLLFSCNTYKGQVDSLFNSMTSDSTPGCMIAVYQDGEYLYKEGFGMANLEDNIPITSKTIFNVGSVSKQFTAYSIFLLDDRGQLSTTDDIRDYIPELPDFGYTITIEDLIYHRSGLRSDEGLFAVKGMFIKNDDRMSHFIKPIFKDDIIQLAVNQKHLNFTPGKNFSYSNTGYVLLAEIVSRVSDKTFIEFTDDEIFKKLGMLDSGFKEEINLEGNTKSYYLSADGEYKPLDFLDLAVGSSQLHTNVEDMIKWMTYLNKAINENDSVLNKMITAKHFVAGGLFAGELNGHDAYFHDGFTPCFHSSMLIVPEMNLSYINLSNNLEIMPTSYTMKIFDTIVNKNDMEVLDIPGDYEVDPDILQKYVGKYYLEAYGTSIDVFVKDNKLHVGSSGFNIPHGELIPFNDSTYYSMNLESRLTFVIDKRDNVIFTIESQGLFQKARRITKSDNDLSVFTGIFYNDELDVTYEIELKDGQLYTTTVNGEIINLYNLVGYKIHGDSWFFTHLDYRKGYSEFLLTTASYTNNKKDSRSRNILFKRVN